MFGGERGIHHSININILLQYKAYIPTNLPTHYSASTAGKFHPLDDCAQPLCQIDKKPSFEHGKQISDS